MPEPRSAGEAPATQPENAAALAHSKTLYRLIAKTIAEAGGWISFARYMELALHAPGLGYYSAGAVKLGSAGDFVTAPEISPLFARALARQIAQVLAITDGDVLEFGAGSGKLARDLLRELAVLGGLPRHYRILELSADLRERQERLLAESIPELLERVQWIERLPDHLNGVLLANEVLDSMPVHLVAWRQDGLYERGVGLADNGDFVWRERALEDDALSRAAREIDAPAGYVSEVHLVAQAFVRSLAARLQRGIALLIDYGFSSREYYHPQRAQGTLMCHFRHRAHADPFFLPGLQDITAHIDFSALARAAEQAGLRTLGYARQANFLIDCGIMDLLAQFGAGNAAVYLPIANQVHRLLSPNEMGDLFKVLALGRGIDTPLLGFRDPRGAARL